MLLARPAHGQCQYEVIQLDYPINCAITDVITRGSGLNEHGAVVGSYKCASWTHTEAFLWTAEDGFVTLPRPPGVCSSAALDISDNGTIVGTYGGVCYNFRGFVYQNAQYTELPPLRGPYSWANAIDNAGTVVGRRTIRDTTAPYNAFIWSAEDGFTDLGVMSGPDSSAVDIGPAGQVVGWTGNHSGSIRDAFLWQDGELTLLGPIPGGFTSGAGGSTADNLIVGSGRIQSGPDVVATGFMWREGGFQLIDAIAGYDTSGVGDINSARQVAGSSRPLDNSSDRHAFLWQHGVTHDLNDLVPRGTLLIARAQAINDQGQILTDGGLHSFLLTPVDRPLGDLDIDCAVGLSDVEMLIEAWGPCPGACPPSCAADLDGDGAVGIVDFLMLLANWGPCS
jgi:uncharacterized membrane protein